MGFGDVWNMIFPLDQGTGEDVPCHGHVRYPHRERAEVLLLSAADILRDAAYIFDPSIGCWAGNGCGCDGVNWLVSRWAMMGMGSRSEQWKQSHLVSLM